MAHPFMFRSNPTQRPPFAGPPPIPAGVNIHPNEWAKGSWRHNSNYQGHPSQQQEWAPAPAWGHQQQQAQQQQQANFNPYKKQPKPPSAAYLATKLSDNPLGLTDMVPRKDLFGAENAATPWQWNPRELADDGDDDDDDDDSDSSDDDSPPSPSHRHARSSSRQNTDPTPTLRTGFRPPIPRHSSEPPPNTSSGGTPTRGVSSASAAAAAAAANRGSSQQGTPSRQSDEPPESFTSKIPLRPTFSPNIIRTPEYYQSRMSTASVSSPSRRNSADGGSIASGITSKSPDQASSSKQPLGRHSSLPPNFQTEPVSNHSRRSHNPISGSSHLVEEPVSLLSPLIIEKSPVPHVASTRPVGRGGSMPNVIGPSTGLDTIDERPKERSSKERSSREKSSRDREKSSREKPSREKSTREKSSREKSSKEESSREKSSKERSSKEKSRGHHSSTSHHQSGTQSRKSSSSPSPTKYDRYTLPSHSRSSSTQPSPVVSRQQTPTPPSNVKHSHQTITPPNHGYSSQNPLPTPPIESSYVNNIYGRSSASAAAAAYQTVPIPSSTPQKQNAAPYHPPATSSASASASRHYRHATRQESASPSPPQPTSTVRKGFWNRRGDHLVGEYVVYAPPHKAYPHELKGYPTDTFRDHKGNLEVLPPGSRELPESLPRKGHQPERPYESFLAYVPERTLA